jgi:uncharacterized protein
MPKHQLLTREESLRASELIRARLGHDRHLKITAAALTKAQGEGEFVGYAATFDTEPDLQGDIIAPRAFVQSIRDWKARGAMPPLLWNHEWDTPATVLGVVTDMVEDSRGLLVTGQLDLTHEPAEAVYRAMKSGRITAFSFAFAIIAEHKDGEVNVLDELDVLDITVTPSPANLNARLVSIKAEPKRTINRKALEEFVALGQALLQVSGEPEALPPHPEVAHYTKVLDDLEHTKAGPALDPDAVDRFVIETRQTMVEEKLAEAEQAAWERSQVNVIDPLPVRVDARMRPVTS